MTVEDAEEIVDSPTPWVAKHVKRYVDSGGQKGHLFYGSPTLLIATRGRKTGKLRRTALIYGRDGDRYLLVASNGGSARQPQWYLNLVADPEVQVQVQTESFTARARTATAEEKQALWPTMAAIFPTYDRYEAKTRRDLPLVILERV
jgi:deazaflavin-dependent oxidoreductase (nitroreductase family)